MNTVLEFDATNHAPRDHPSRSPADRFAARPAPPTVKARLAILDTADGVGTRLKPDLVQSGFAVKSIAGIDQLHQLLDEGACDIILLAADMRGVSSHDLIQDIRRRCSVGVVMTAGAADVSDRVLALEFGADEFLCASLEQREAIARIRSLARRLNMSPTENTSGFRFSGLRLDLVTRRLMSDNGDEVRLTSREFEVLALLLENANRPVRREEIQGTSHSYQDSRAADALVGRIRKKLREACIRDELIRPIRSVGYVLAANVSRV